LQQLEPGRLPIAIHQPLDVRGDRRELGVRLAGPWRRLRVARDVVRPLSAEPADHLADFGAAAVLLQVFADVAPRERKEGIVNERDWRRRPLDVEDDGADRVSGELNRQLRGVPEGGKYAGPKQTG
jgi:hypothetical protein